MQFIAVLLGLLRVLTGELLLGPAGLTAVAAAATLVLLAAVAAGVLAGRRRLGARAPALVRSATLRRRALRTAFLPQRDPDARGRRRPRAPGAAPAAA
ncbi:DUF6412 domain-containing protein [Kitasatospora sp. GP82]|uniref:DUF6412 domain-containing protein n=1 Tax=Kitasatospora sp. GP82 TaxID=3035089 RepID=UPI00247308EF|nr:DUF6412 domain-containing protein [Kitasatospora sp. GP82]MDH6126612.1 hypothetical protein [Kitasatospora sp. GP82]